MSNKFFTLQLRQCTYFCIGNLFKLSDRGAIFHKKNCKHRHDSKVKKTHYGLRYGNLTVTIRYLGTVLN